MEIPEESGQKTKRRTPHWVWLALLFPLFFFVVSAAGIGFMYFKRMAIFKPAHGARCDPVMASMICKREMDGLAENVSTRPAPPELPPRDRPG